MPTNVEKKLPVFQERFNELRGKLSQEAFAKKIGVSRPVVGFYENGGRVPDALTLKKIAERCKVSTDYLLGLSDVPTTDPDIRKVCEITGLQQKAVENIINIKNEINIPRELGFDDATCKALEDNALLKIKIVNRLLAHKDFSRFLDSVVTHIKNIDTLKSKTFEENVQAIYLSKHFDNGMADYFSLPQNIINGSAYEMNRIADNIIVDIVEKLIAEGREVKNGNDH